MRNVNYTKSHLPWKLHENIRFSVMLVTDRETEKPMTEVKHNRRRLTEANVSYTLWNITLYS